MVYGRDGNLRKIWKDGEVEIASEGTLSAIVAVGNDVLLGGNVLENERAIAAIWRNGQEQRIGDPSHHSYLNSMAVSGSDVYAVGARFAPSRQAVVWKNGSVEALPESSSGATPNSVARTVWVSGSDVYVGGFSSGRAMIWKNREGTNLGSGVVSSVRVVGNDLYAVGFTRGSTEINPTFWKNGEIQPLTEGSKNGQAVSISVVGSDVYIAGMLITGTRAEPVLWKNGDLTRLPNGEAQTFVTGMYVHEDDVYVIGWQGSANTPVPRMWKNGQLVEINQNSTLWSPNAVLVKLP